MCARIQFRENMRGGAAELERGLGRDRLDIRDPADAVRSKNFPVLAHPAYSTSPSGIRKPEKL